MRAFAAGKVQPYTLHLTEVVRAGSSLNGPGTRSRDLIVAQRSDGSRVEVELLFPGQPQAHQVRSISDPDMRLTKAWDSVGLKTTGVPWKAKDVSRYRAMRPTVESDCMANGLGQEASSTYRFSGKEWIGDLLVVKMVRDSPHHVEAWHAPLLGCQEVRRAIAFKGCCTSDNMDPNALVTDSSELGFVGYSLDEPDAKLFDVSGLKESPPGAANAARLIAAGLPEDQVKKATASYRTADDLYRRLSMGAGLPPNKSDQAGR